MKVEQLDDLIPPVKAVLSRCEKKYLQTLYNVPEFAHAQEFLALLARATGRLKKGGVPDLDAAAKTVLGDWNNGKIRYYTHPPEAAPAASNEESSAILSEFSAEFSLDSLQEAMETDRGMLPDLPVSSATSVIAPSKEPEVRVSVAVLEDKAAAGKADSAQMKQGKSKAQPAQSLKTIQKKALKKEKKKRNRQEKLGHELSDIMDASM